MMLVNDQKKIPTRALALIKQNQKISRSKIADKKSKNK